MSDRTWEFESPRGHLFLFDTSGPDVTIELEILPRVVPVETPWPRLVPICRPSPRSTNPSVVSRAAPSSWRQSAPWCDANAGIPVRRACVPASWPSPDALSTLLGGHGARVQWQGRIRRFRVRARSRRKTGETGPRVDRQWGIGRGIAVEVRAVHDRLEGARLPGGGRAGAVWPIGGHQEPAISDHLALDRTSAAQVAAAGRPASRRRGPSRRNLISRPAGTPPAAHPGGQPRLLVPDHRGRDRCGRL